MSIESLAIHRREYEANLADRLMESQLGVGGLCTAIFAIQRSQLALKFPVRIAGLAMPLSGVIAFMALDKDLRPATRVIPGRMEEGLISDRYRMDPLGFTEQGYFMGYEEDFDLEFELIGFKERSLLVNN